MIRTKEAIESVGRNIWKNCMPDFTYYKTNRLKNAHKKDNWFTTKVEIDWGHFYFQGDEGIEDSKKILLEMSKPYTPEDVKTTVKVTRCGHMVLVLEFQEAR